MKLKFMIESVLLPRVCCLSQHQQAEYLLKKRKRKKEIRRVFLSSHLKLLELHLLITKFSLLHLEQRNILCLVLLKDRG